MSKEQLSLIEQKIRTIPDFPKPGIQFRDVATLFKDPHGLQAVIDVFVEHFKPIHEKEPIHYIAGLEARGFVLGPSIALRLGIGFIMVRKKGKLPGDVIGHTYDLEYGSDTVEVQADAVKKGDRVVVIDDLIATGGTLLAACTLLEKLGANVVECACIVELPDLHGRSKLQDRQVYTMIEFQGERSEERV